MNRCPTRHRFAEELSNGASKKMREHLDSCASCRDEWSSTEAAIDLARRLPDGIPSPDALLKAEQRLLSAARSRATGTNPRRRARLVGVIAAAAAFLLVTSAIVIALNRDTLPLKRIQPVEHNNAVVVAKGDARFNHTNTSDDRGQDETVHLEDGAITLHVEPLMANERFRVLTDDAVIEVRGTVFSVTASNRSLVAVAVESGKVLVSPDSGDEVLLTKGGRWRRRDADNTAGASRDAAPAPDDRASTDETSTSRPSSANGIKAVSRRNRGSAVASKKSDVNADALFKRGWERFKAGAFGEAGEIFDEAASTVGHVPQAEDLYFWRAAAHFKSGRKNSAGRALREFLRFYPSALRKEEIRAMYGWHLLEIGELDAAQKEFSAAMESPVGPVRESARKGMSRVQAQLEGRE